MPFTLAFARRVVRKRLAHIVLAAEIFGRAGRPVAAIDGAAEALVEIVGGHADVEFLAAGQPADFARHRLARLEIGEGAVLVVAAAIGEAARHADLRRPAGIVGAADRRRKGCELAGDPVAVVVRLRWIGGDLAGEAGMAGKHCLGVLRQQALRQLDAAARSRRQRRADGAAAALPVLAEMLGVLRHQARHAGIRLQIFRRRPSHSQAAPTTAAGSGSARGLRATART